MHRTLATFLIAPVIGACAGALAMTPFVHVKEGLVGFTIFFALVATGIAQLITLIIGYPAFLLLRRREKRSFATWLGIALLASLIGVVAVQGSLVLLNQSWPPVPVWPEAFVIIFAVTCTLVTATVILRMQGVASAA
jgi:hypothetical protein